ncbi:MAG: RagB/SusD family nutrient uptake outer membrane protein [Butyricimonas faecihominis]
MESWGTHYSAIYLANMLEENRFRFENISEDRAEYWLAQANFVKAYMYFDLARNWGDVPLAPGTESVVEVPKTSVDTILQEAIRCAEKALILPTYDKLMDANGTAVPSKQYASLGTVHTLLANIYAWMGGLYGKEEYWKKAEEHASLVIDNKVGIYDLEKTVAAVVNNTLGPVRNSLETIFSIAINEQDADRYWSTVFECCYPGCYLVAYPYNGKTVQEFEDDRNNAKITIGTVENIYPEEEDVRRKEFWKDLGKVVSHREPVWDVNDEGEWVETKDSVDVLSKYAFINKWNKPINSVNPSVTEAGEAFLLAMDGDRVVWRLADLILLRAECRARLKMPAAVDDLDRIGNVLGWKSIVVVRTRRCYARKFSTSENESFSEKDNVILIS